MADWKGELEIAAEELVSQLRLRIDGVPDRPWIPGGQFKDGELFRAIDRVEEILDKL